MSSAALEKLDALENKVSGMLAGCSDMFLGQPPRNEAKASRILRTYIVEAFDLTLADYESRPHYRAEWINEIVSATIDSFIGLFPELTIGCDKFRPELQRTLKDHLAERVKATLVTAEKPKRIDRKKLRDEYMARFEGVKILDICWAGQQHYREWKRWLKQEVKDGSAPDVAFRRILTSGKRPEELVRKPRKRGWQ